MIFLRLAWHSLHNRRGAVLLTFVSIAISTFALLGIEYIRQQGKVSFSNTVSGVDLIVGARTSDVNLLLYSVFRLGSPSNNIAWKSYQQISSRPEVAWSVPISLGDSHKGYRVMGTTKDYFAHFRYGDRRALELSKGQPFAEVFDVVLGAEVAKALEYQLGDRLVLAHGVAKTSFSLHEDKPFKVVGILESTGTPVDQTLHVSLAGVGAIHKNWQSTGPAEATALSQQRLTPTSITAFMVGMHSRMQIFRFQRSVNTYSDEPLVAILPGVALTQLWQIMSVMEDSLGLISALVLLASVMGLSAMLLSSIREREREIAVMRVMGARPWFLFALIQAEALLITLMSIGCALLLLVTTTGFAQGWFASQFAVSISGYGLTRESTLLIGVVVLSAVVSTIFPAFAAYSAGLHSRLSQ